MTTITWHGIVEFLEDEKLYCWGDAGSCSRDSESYSYTEVTTKYSGTCYGYASSVKVFGGSACANPVLCEHKCNDDITCEGFTSTCSDPSRAGTETDCAVCSDPSITTEADCVVFVQHVAAGKYHTCAILNDDTVKCWGLNDHGQLGYEDTENRGDGSNEMGNNLATVDLGKTVKQLDAGEEHTCAILNDDTLKCWGGMYGRLGYGDHIQVMVLMIQLIVETKRMKWGIIYHLLI